MSRRLLPLLLLALLCFTAGCAQSGELDATATNSELRPSANAFGPSDPLWAPQPTRERPSAIAASNDGGELYVTLQGTEERPGRTLAIVDAHSLQTRSRVEVGPGPCAVAVHPAGRFAIVLLRFARYAAVVDLQTRAVVLHIAAPYYSEGVVWSHDGRHAFVTNRWLGSVLQWDVQVSGTRFEVSEHELWRGPDDEPIGVQVPRNPRRIYITDDDRYLLVTSEGALSVSLLDTRNRQVLQTYSPGAPVTDALAIGKYVYVLHTGSGTGHPPDSGFDGDHSVSQGDGTANVGLQDVQNEIDVLELPTFARAQRYTSDSICCHDFRDVDPDHPQAGAALAAADAWPASRARFMPARDSWLVAGALPERAVRIARADGSAALAVVYSGSREAQTFDVDAKTGALSAHEDATLGLYRTGLGASDAVALDDGHALVVVNRLGESLTWLDLTKPPAPKPHEVVVGDTSAGAFPATDVELGEALYMLTAAFSIDGDVSCAHCHRDGSAIGKQVSMPYLAHPDWGLRQIMPLRGNYDSRPWFLEASVDDKTGVPELNELARQENFCCEQLDARVWSHYPARAQCQTTPTLAGCNHVLHCESDPPSECGSGAWAGRALTRDAHFREAAKRVLGRDHSFGDALTTTVRDSRGKATQAPMPLDFAGAQRALGLFLLATNRALPNPNAAAGTAWVEQGRSLFSSNAVGCASCHPLPVAATARATSATPAHAPLRFSYVVTPLRRGDTLEDVELVTPSFVHAYPDTVQTAAGLRIGAPSLRGSWDRVSLLHHGMAHSLLETLATPGHPALTMSQQGWNSRDGQLDTHGSTSQLSASELRALLAFVQTL